MNQPQIYLREILGGPNARYIRRVLVEGVYVDAPPICHSPEFTAQLREVAMIEVNRIRAAQLGKPPTEMIQ
jgi:hypothetical protein